MDDRAIFEVEEAASTSSATVNTLKLRVMPHLFHVFIVIKFDETLNPSLGNQLVVINVVFSDMFFLLFFNFLPLRPPTGLTVIEAVICVPK